MTRLWMLLALMLCPIALFAQTGSSGSGTGSRSAPYQPAVPAASTNTYGGWYGGYTGASTAAGSALNGMAGVISAKGDYNLSTSAAAVNMTQAQKNEIENRQQWTNTYFDMRETNRRARAAERGPAPTMEQIARMAKEGAPRPLNPHQVDPVSGRIAWPSALQDTTFDGERGAMDSLFATWARYGGLNYADQTKVRHTVNTMYDELKSRITQIPPQDYAECRSFLRSLNYAASQTEMQ